MKSSGTRTETVHPGSSLSTPPTSRLVTIAERSGSFDESVGYSDAKEDDEEEYLEEKAAMPDLSEAAVVSVGRSGGVRSLARNLTEELDDVAGPEPTTEDSDDGSDGLKPLAMTGKTTSRSTGNRPPVNGDTPAANKVLGRCLELMKTRSNWMQLFGPKQARQAVWMDLGVAQDTVLLLRAMGCEPQKFPSDAALKDWTPTDAGTALRKWKKKLRTSFGVSEIGAGRQPIARRAPEAADPSKVPLPQTPKKRVNEGSDAGVFTATAEASPYMQDSHMVTPRNYDSPEDSSDSDSDSGDFDYLDGDLTEELNGYARNAGVQFDNGGRDAKDHMEHFLDTCDDRGLEGRLCHVRVKDIHDLEDMVNDILRRRERPDQTAQTRAIMVMTAQGHLATTNGAGTAADVPVRAPTAILVPTVNTIMLQPPTTVNAGPLQRVLLPGPTTDTPGAVMVTSTKTEATDETTDSALHDAGKCDALNELTNLLRSKVEKKDLTPELQSLLTEPAIDADYMFAFAGEVNWPEDREITSVASMSRVERSPRNLVPRTKLLPGERLGWWSSQRYDKRKRMRALVKGAVNDVRTRILLDTGANVSVISANYAKRLRLPLVKITLGWERVYEFEMWSMNHSAGVDVVLGTDFMIPAGVRLDQFHGTARLPDEVMVPLIKSLSAADDEPYGTQYKVWQILAYAESRDETLFERERELYECWLAEQPPAVERREYPTPQNILTRDAEDSVPVDESQFYCAQGMAQATDTTGKECGRRDYPLAFRAVADASDGVAVERIPTEESEHTIPVSESGDRVFEQAQRQSSIHATDDAAYTESSNRMTSENIGTSVQIPDEPDDRAIHTPCPTEDPECILNAIYNDVSEHLANDIELTDYAQELAFLPDLTEVTFTALDYTGPNVHNKDLDVDQQQKLVDVLKRHEKIMISSGNALPPPAYGVVCDIDVGINMTAVKQWGCVTVGFLGRMYELLKG
ncbi:Hypothetical protein PHPALM_10204, partial [Phytophthora palmivora]